MEDPNGSYGTPQSSDIVDSFSCMSPITEQSRSDFDDSRRVRVLTVPQLNCSKYNRVAYVQALPVCVQASSYYDADAPQKRLHGNFVVIRPKTALAQSIFHGKSSEKIPEEEAICRFCNDMFKGENGVMLICKCSKNTLAHESSSEQNNKNCEACEQELQKVIVTLQLKPYSTYSRKCKIKKGSLVSRLRRIWLCSS